MCRDEAPIWSVAALPALSNKARLAASGVRMRGPVTGVNGTDDCSLG